MRRIAFFLLLAFLFSCGENPLSQRADPAEERTEQMESQVDADQKALLDRLGGITVTADNADEIERIRAKLQQADISRDEFLRLQRRVEALENRIQDWSQVVASLQRSVYAVLHGVFIDDDDVEITFIGTGFAVDPTTLVTNAHVVDALNALDKDTRKFNQRFSTNLSTGWIVVQNLTTFLRYKSNYYLIAQFARHPRWNPADLSSPDVGTLHVAEGTILRTAHLAPRSAVFRLRPGQPIATLGFPGELQGGNLGDLFPIATFKNGTISALRPPFHGRPYNVRDTYIVQHNLDLSGGTSGSPIFDPTGTVIAVNNAGIEGVVMTISGQPTRISQAALGFGIRADKIHDLLDQVGIPAKPVAENAPRGAIGALEGRNLGDLRIGKDQGDLIRRLTRRLGLADQE